MEQNTSDLLRQRLITARTNLPITDRQHGSLIMSTRLFTWLANTIDDLQSQGRPTPRCIAAFWPLGNEPDLRALMHQCDDAGLIVLLPVMTGRGKPLEFHRWRADMTLLKGPFGVQEPPSIEPHRPDIVLVPTLGFTSKGDRMGYGQGFYDRTLDALKKSGPTPMTIGIAWNEGAIDALVPHYQAAQHDYRLDAVLTPNGWATGIPVYPAPPRMAC